MLITMKSILELAEARKTAVGAFNISSLEGLQAVLGAAEELRQPVILSYAPGHSTLIPMSVIGPIMVMMAERSFIPVCVHLDHCDDFAIIRDALELGFTSVMYDGSVLPFAENTANTKIVVELAQAYGASVEAELGAMGRQEFASFGGTDEQEELAGSYTDPEEAARFTQSTGIDALACSFGTVHGLYMTAPKLDFERIARIREQINVPIVMHGGSGVSDEDTKRCVSAGVRKINYYTYLAKAGGMRVKEACAGSDGNVYFHDISLWAIAAMKEDALHAIRVFSNLAP